jgi:hypothetical protein
MESNTGRIFGAVDITEQDAQKDWRELPRSEMLERVIVAVDGAKMEAEEVGDENYVRYVDAALFPFLEAELKKATGEADSRMAPEERALYDARAQEEAWGFVLEVLEPWMETARLIGNDELVQVMKNAQAEATAELNRALDVLEPLQGSLRSEDDE